MKRFVLAAAIAAGLWAWGAGTNRTDIAGQFYANEQSDALWITPTAQRSFTNAPLCWVQGELRTATFPYARQGRRALLGYRGTGAATNELTFKIGETNVLTATVETTRGGGWQVISVTNVAQGSLWFTNNFASPRTTVPCFPTGIGDDGTGTNFWSEAVQGMASFGNGTLASNVYSKTTWEATVPGAGSVGSEFVVQFFARRGANGEVCGLRLTAKYRFANTFAGGNCWNYPQDGSGRWLMAKRGSFADFPLTQYGIGNEFDVAGVDDSPATTRYVDALPRLVFEAGGLAVYTNGVKAGTLGFTPAQ